MKFGYARVSKNEQSLDIQVRKLLGGYRKDHHLTSYQKLLHN